MRSNPAATKLSPPEPGPPRPDTSSFARRGGWAAVGFAAFLLAYGNGISTLPDEVHEDHAWPLMAIGLVVMLASLAWATRLAGLSWAEIGLARGQLRRGAALGAAAGVVVILPVVLYFVFPVGLPGGEIDYEESRRTTTAGFLSFVLIRQPLGTSIFEEVVFRGILQALSLRTFAFTRGIVFVAVVFAAWHVVVNLRTVATTSAGGELATTVGSVAASMAALLIGSVAMSLLRVRTGSLAGPIAFHWAVVVLMQGTLFLQSR